MLIIPAIDIKDKKCVRLIQGDYNNETIYSDNPVEVAKDWEEKGTKFIHLVDLNGAAEGKPVNLDVIKSIIKNVSSIKIQVGGGIRTNDTVERLLEAGVFRVIIGTRAVKNPEWVNELCKKFPGQIAVSIDTRDGNIATEGWLQTEDKPAIDFVKEMLNYNLGAIIVTDIKKDGMLKGPNLALMQQFKNEIREIPIIASGGVSSISDIKELNNLNIDGAIIGKALYDKKIKLEDAINCIKL